MTDTHALGWDECEQLVEWFTHRMSQETRHDLMADLPQLYGKLYPGVDPSVITAAVLGKLNRIAVERRGKLATELDLGPADDDLYPCAVRPDGEVTK